MQIPLQFRWHFVVTSQTPRISKVNLLLFLVGELQCCFVAVVSSWKEKHREHSHNVMTCLKAMNSCANLKYALQTLDNVISCD